jgi:hypothetical protein
VSSVPVFHGRITMEGKFLLDEAERDRRRVYFQALAGKDVEIVVRKIRVQRSVDQNAYLHAVPFPMLAEVTGYTLTEIKYVLMGECWGWKGIGGHEIPVKAHTSDLSVDECKQFIDWLIPWSMEKFGLAIPLPGEAL